MGVPHLTSQTVPSVARKLEKDMRDTKNHIDSLKKDLGCEPFSSFITDIMETQTLGDTSAAHLSPIAS